MPPIVTQLEPPAKPNSQAATLTEIYALFAPPAYSGVLGGHGTRIESDA